MTDGFDKDKFEPGQRPGSSNDPIVNDEEEETEKVEVDTAAPDPELTFLTKEQIMAQTTDEEFRRYGNYPRPDVCDNAHRVRKHRLEKGLNKKNPKTVRHWLMDYYTLARKSGKSEERAKQREQERQEKEKLEKAVKLVCYWGAKHERSGSRFFSSPNTFIGNKSACYHANLYYLMVAGNSRTALDNNFRAYCREYLKTHGLPNEKELEDQVRKRENEYYGCPQQ